MTSTPEFSRPVRIDSLSAVPRTIEIEAGEEERAALARRFGLIGIDALRAEASVTRSGDEVAASGSLRAAVTQSCVGTGVPVPADVEETFFILFRPHPATAAAEEEIELSEGEMDVVFYDGAAVDLGDAVSESLFLSLDPYPRSSDSSAALKEAGVLSEEEAAPPSPLAGLKDLLEGKTKG